MFYITTSDYNPSLLFGLTRFFLTSLSLPSFPCGPEEENEEEEETVLDEILI